MEVIEMAEEQNTNVSETTTTPKTYTEDEVMKLLQSESDKRVTQALKKQQAKHDKELSLAALDADERMKVESADRIAELEQQLAELQAERNRSEMKTALAARGLDVAFADILNVGDDVETAQAQIETLDRIFKAAVKAEIEQRLVSNTPKGNGGKAPSITKEAAKNMSVKELQTLKKSNPDAYRNIYN